MRFFSGIYSGILSLFIIAGLHAQQEAAPSDKLQIKAPAIEITVRDSLLLQQLKKYFGEPAALPDRKDETAILKLYEGQGPQDIRMMLFSDIKDIIDEKAMKAEGTSFADLKLELQEELIMLAKLREQVGLNWMEEFLRSKGGERPSPAEIASLVNTELAAIISDEAIKNFFLDEKASKKSDASKKAPAKKKSSPKNSVKK